MGFCNLELDMSHHPKTIRLYERLVELDVDDYFDFKSGGDGDNGEELMKLLDLYFKEEQSNGFDAALRRSSS
jgi:hypothetical protein